MKRTLAYLLVTLALCASAQAADRPSNPGTASDYADADSHANENVVIAADPFDDRDRVKFFRLDYLAAGLMPIRVIFTNNSDRPIVLDDVRIQFIAANGEKLPAANHDEIFRRLSHDSDAAKGTLPGPIPFHMPKGKSLDQKIDDDMNDFAIPATVVEPHRTLSGFLLYDVSGLDNPVLQHAQIYIKMIKDSAGKDLFPFTIDLDKQPSRSNHAVPATAGPSPASQPSAKP